MRTDPGARRRFGPGWADKAQRMVAQFRATHDLRARNPVSEALMARLRTGSPEFVAWWEAYDIRRRGYCRSFSNCIQLKLHTVWRRSGHC